MNTWFCTSCVSDSGKGDKSKAHPRQIGGFGRTSDISVIIYFLWKYLEGGFWAPAKIHSVDTQKASEWLHLIGSSSRLTGSFAGLQRNTALCKGINTVESTQNTGNVNTKPLTIKNILTAHLWGGGNEQQLFLMVIFWLLCCNATINYNYDWVFIWNRRDEGS